MVRISFRQRLRWFARSRLVRGIVIGVVAVGVAGTIVLAVTPANGGAVGGSTIVVDNSPGDQLDPHVSGDIAAYTDASDPAGQAVIRYYDFLSPVSPNASIPGGIDDIDTLSDVNGSHIAFARYNPAAGTRACMVFDVVTHNTIQIGSGTQPFATALGGDTVAFANGASAQGDILAGRISDPTRPLTDVSASSDNNIRPAVSPAGNVIVWSACPSGMFTNCSIMKSILSGGVWSPPSVVRSAPADNPDTDGTNIVYDSGGDIYYQSVGGGAATQLAIAGVERNPSIAGGVIAFEGGVDDLSPADLFVYQISTNLLFRVTDTPFTHESLNDVTVLGNGDVRVVWAANDDAAAPLAHNIYARTFSLPQPAVSFNVCLLYDPTRVVRSGATLPIKIQLCNANGANQSSSSIVVTAGAVRMVNSVTPPTAALDTGNANPDSNFRFDPTLGGSGGYIFNLSTRGLASGTYALAFTATGDSTTHEVLFAVK